MSAQRGNQSTSFDLDSPTERELERLTSELDDQTREVMLDRETEAPSCGAFLSEAREGTFTCRLCGLPLFESAAKIHTGDGWVAFVTPVAERHLRYTDETSFRVARTEVSCCRCGGHQGHVFSDRASPTGKRYCNNSLSLEFTPDGEILPDKLRRGAPEGSVWRSACAKDVSA
jgi:peptide-methionine (R)-S-oxide reductase